MLRNILAWAKRRCYLDDTETCVKVVHDENQYIGLIEDILDDGTMITGRNGNVKTIIGSAMHFDLRNNTLPLLTTKRVAWITCLKELLWFISGKTDNGILQDNNVHIWDANASREFLDSRGLHNNRENDLGPVYGHQWRHFNAEYETCDTSYEGKGIDQLQYIIDELKSPDEVRRHSRRLILSAWNPCQLDEMALPPCHVLCQFNVVGNELSCSLYQRSADVGLGVPFNIASYSMLTHLLAKHCNLEATDFYYHLGNCHIYEQHMDAISKQVTRIPHKFPTLNITTQCDNINDYTKEMFVVSNYVHHDAIKMSIVG